MAILKKKKQTVTERLLKIVAEGKAHLNKDLGKEIKQQIEDLSQAAQKALTTKHKAELEKAKEQLKAVKEENNKLASQLKAKNRLLEKINKITGE